MEQIGLEPSDGEIVYCELSLLIDQWEEYDTPGFLYYNNSFYYSFHSSTLSINQNFSYQVFRHL